MTFKKTIRTQSILGLKKTLANNIIEKLNARINYLNFTHDVNLKLVTDDGSGISAFWRFIFTRGKTNYIILSGPKKKDVEEVIGYAGTDIALLAQELGLSVSWFLNPISKSIVKHIADGEVTFGIIAIGYGKQQSVCRCNKTADEVCSYDGTPPEWFKNGIKSALGALTLMPEPDFRFLGKDNMVILANYSQGKYSAYEKGIVKYHFEVGAGRDNFVWE